MFGTGLPSRFINIAVPVNFFHLERAVGGGPFPVTAAGAFIPLASPGLAGAAVPPLVEGKGDEGLGLVDTVPEATEGMHGEVGWLEEG